MRRTMHILYDIYGIYARKICTAISIAIARNLSFKLHDVFIYIMLQDEHIA